MTELSGGPEADSDRRPPALRQALYPVVPPAFASFYSVMATRCLTDLPLYQLSYGREPGGIRTRDLAIIIRVVRQAFAMMVSSTATRIWRTFVLYPTELPAWHRAGLEPATPCSPSGIRRDVRSGDEKKDRDVP